MGGTVRAITIQLDYSLDTTGFFTNNPTAKAALEAAAGDISAAILPSLGAVSTDVFVGTNGASTVTIDWGLSFEHPATGVAQTLSSFSFPADAVRIYVGARNLSGNTLGQGGPGGASFGIETSTFPGQLAGALTAAQNLSNATMLRGRGPVIGSFQGTVGGAPYDLGYGAMVGNLWFDSDTNNDGFTDTSAQLNAAWHFNHTTTPAAGKDDFYSVALHELLHAIGFGVSDTWDSLVSGNNWLGAAAIAQAGSGIGLVSPGHVASGVMSVRLSDGLPQEVVMDPTLTQGTRKSLTQLDLAFLRDLGYITVPEPRSSLFLLVGLGWIGCAVRRRRKES
jgi:hypothetical protein